MRLGMQSGSTLLQLNAGSGGSAEIKSLVRLIQHSPCNGKRYNTEQISRNQTICVVKVDKTHQPRTNELHIKDDRDFPAVKFGMNPS